MSAGAAIRNIALLAAAGGAGYWIYKHYISSERPTAGTNLPKPSSIEEEVKKIGKDIKKKLPEIRTKTHNDGSGESKDVTISSGNNGKSNKEVTIYTKRNHGDNNPHETSNNEPIGKTLSRK